MTKHQRLLDMSLFFPNELTLLGIHVIEACIEIDLKSNTHSFKCPSCGQISTVVRGTYTRKVQDLPIFGKTVWLNVVAREYACQNPECATRSVVETFDGLVALKKRMTLRCQKSILDIAQEASCEGCARLCKKLGYQVSGDTVIRMLLEHAAKSPPKKAGDCIGIDDFAYKKGQSYCTVIVDEETHEVIDILEGRDGKTLRSWLKKNRHIRIITRDRASAYSSAIHEILPDAIQVADRFHLLQNLLTHIQSIIKAELPATIKVPTGSRQAQDSNNKTIGEQETAQVAFEKGEADMLEKFNEVLDLHEAGYSNRFIAKHLKMSRNTVAKVLNGNPAYLCRKTTKRKLDALASNIVDNLKANKTIKTVYVEMKQQGYDVGSISNFYTYANKIVAATGIELQRFKRQPLPDGTIPEKDFTYLNRSMIMNYIWRNEALDAEQIKYLYEEHRIVAELRKKVIEFRKIFIEQAPHLLYAFIDNCISTASVKLRSFAKGILQDFDAVDQAVSSQLSNGFVEGTNNKIKMVKRQMYGRAHLPLLKAKLMF